MDGSPSSLRSVFLLTVLMSLLAVTGSEGQTTSITSSGLGTTISPPSIDPAGRPNYIITGGTRPGDGPNLFHSFGDFSVGTNNVARFSNETGRATTNILSRVTGGQTSNIYGAIQTSGFGTAALWLINPAGIVFGPSASLNVGGSVHFSTADYLRLGSGNDRFYADLGKTSQLTSAPVTAFGFLGSNAAGTISVQGGTVEGSQTLSLVGRDRTVGDTVTPGIEVTGGTLSNPAGRINLISVGTPQNQTAGGEINASDLTPSPTLDFSSMGGVTLSRSATVQTNASSAGSIFVRGGQLVLEGGSSIQVKTVDGASGGIDIQVASDVTLKNGSFLATETSGSGNGGNVTVRSANLFLENQTTIDSFSDNGGGKGGDITLQVAGDVSLKNSWLATGTVGSGDAGQLMITARNISLTDGSFMLTATFPAVDKNSITTGKGGNISMQASDSISLSEASIRNETQGAGDGGMVTITARDVSLKNNSDMTTYTFSTGRVGNVSIDARDSFAMSDSNLISGGQRSIDKESQNTDPGDVAITATHVRLNNNSSVKTESNHSGNTGNLTIVAGDVTLSESSSVTTATFPNSTGTAGNILLNTASLTMNPGTSITASTSGSGNAGNISITATDHVTLFGPGAELATTTSSEGTAGQLNINASQLTMTNGAMISGSSTRVDGPAGGAGAILIGGVNGPATNISLDNSTIRTTISGGNELLISSGNIRLTAHEIRLANGARITADTSGDTPAGSIILNVDNIATSNGARISSQSTSTESGAGPAGEIVIQGGNGERYLAESVNLDGSILSTTSMGGAGHISILARSISLKNGTQIEAETNGDAPAGSIYLHTSDVAAFNNGVGSISIDNSIVSTSGIQGAAGNISVRASDTVRLSAARLTSAAESGKGGTIAIQSGDIVIDNGSLVSTITTGANDAGNITLTSGNNVSIANSTISTSAAAASGGNIDLTAPKMVRLVGANLTSSVNGPANSNGGNITIDTAHPQFVIMQGNSQILAKANEGQGGAITIIGGVVLQEPGSVLDATAGPAGISGSINIQAPFQQLAGAIAPLPQAFAVATNLYGQRCATEKGGQFSSFVQGARDGVPPQPGDLIPSPLLLEPDEAASNISSQAASSLSAIRLGLSGFEQTSYSSLTVFAGCRS